MLFGLLAQLLGGGLIYNIVFFLHYVNSPIEIFAAADQRLLRTNRAYTVLPTILNAYLLPTLATYFYHSWTTRVMLIYVWQLVPIYICVVHWLLSTFIVRDTTKYDRLHNVRADLPALELLSDVLLAVSAVTYQWVRWYSSDLLFLRDIFYQGISDPFTQILSLEQGAAAILRYNYICMWTGALFWLLLLFKDLKRARMLDLAWMRLLIYGGMTLILFGPGATLMAAWMWRERILATRRHWAAVTTG